MQSESVPALVAALENLKVIRLQLGLGFEMAGENSLLVEVYFGMGVVRC